MQKILVIDDDRDMCLLLKRFLVTRGFSVSLAYNSKQALELLEFMEPQLVLCDFRLDNNDGKTMLLRIKEIYPNLPVIIITGYSDIRIAVEVMKLGAYDYVTKPISPDEIIHIINNALNKEVHKPLQSVKNWVNSIKKEKTSYHPPAGNSLYIFGESLALLEIDEKIDTVAPTNHNVIIYGESGSGKEVIAREIHKRSIRHQEPFIAIDCGALSKELAGNELFGNEKGSITSPMHQKAGSFELANGGTIFLDEIASLSPETQLLLLRVLDEKKMRRIGGIKDIALDVRIIIASNEKLWEEDSKKGKLREDLFHRFNEFNITVPPLRERKEDIMMFANHFLKRTNDELDKNILGFSPEVEEIFTNYIWYGNLRELKNVVKRSAVFTDGEYIKDRSLPFEICNFNKLLLEKTPTESIAIRVHSPVSPSSIPRTVLHESTLKEVSIDAEYEMILEALKHTNFNKSKAARFLNIDRKTLYNKMKQYQQINNQ